MDILISGVTGFIGKRLADALDADGHRVSGLSRNSVSARQRVPVLRDAHDWHWRSQKEEPRSEAVEGVDAVVHLAGEPVAGRWTAAKKRRIEESRVRGTQALIEAFQHAEQRPRVLVSASAMGYYGDTGETEVDETSPPGDDFLADVCVQWERAAREAEKLGIRVVLLRTGLVLGKEGGALGSMLPIFRMGGGGALGSGRQWWSWIHEDDQIGLIRFALDQEGLSGPMNLVSPNPVRQGEFAKVLGRVLKRPAFMPAPSFAVKIGLGGFAGEVLGSRRVAPRVALEQGYEFRFPELEPALSDLLG